MYLKRLYTEPSDLFEEVRFKDGINFIFGQKDDALEIKDTKKSLNGIGKSTFLDLLDFCLLATCDKFRNPRLDAAKIKLTGHDIVLEFEIDQEVYLIKRSVDTPNRVLFGVGDNLEYFTPVQLGKKLFQLVFANLNYLGKSNEKWFRSFISFFLKIQKHKNDRFLDPIKFLDKNSEAELVQYHFYLMGIDNTIAYKNYILIEELKRKVPILKEMKIFLSDKYKIEDIAGARNEIDRMKREVKKLDDTINTFKLAEQYSDVEEQANLLTSRIKDLWYENYSDRKKIESYEESISLNTTISSSKINEVHKLYREASQILADNIKKTLEDAVVFRKNLVISRKEFLKNEIKKLNSQVSAREKEVDELELLRSKLFGILETREAIKDLTEAFYELNKKKQSLSDLEAKLETYDSIEFEKLDLEREGKNLEIEIKNFIRIIQNEYIPELSAIFSEIYNAIYPEEKDPLFSISENFKKDSKLEIRVNDTSVMYSKGKNQGRTLLYDLTILFHAIKQKISCPRFLVHDGIFDGMDKAHLIHLYNYLEEKKKTVRFQYIVTLNEEGELSNNFGQSDILNPEKISEISILTLTPTKKLLGDF
ncbi:MAG: DUF2326 domain-containing protein [Patescibacteria group bacterium]